MDGQVLCVAAQLGLAERLAQSGPVTAADLASRISIDTVTVERILRALVSMKVCDELAGSRFQLTSLGEYLRPNHPDSVEARVLVHGQVFYPMWDKLIETVRTGAVGRGIFLPSIQEKEPTKLAWLIANAKEFSRRCRALGLLYSYNCGANRRSHREIEFPVPVPLLGLCMTSAE